MDVIWERVEWGGVGCSEGQEGRGGSVGGLR